ncbi:MAG: DNA polymerase III subunit delta' [Planctomycetia bacterium]|nr:DNA polymerase III subunit delta' [Planctomycetia bacterium]
MSWLGIEGHDALVERFRTALSQRRLASTFLFVGPGGIGKRQFALRFAQTLLCLDHAPEQMNPCGVCESCRQFLAGTHPDLLQVSKPIDRAFLPIDLLIGEKGNRMREGLCFELSRAPFYRKRKIAIIDDADYLNLEGANALLKTLEEPPDRSVLILIGTSAARQLPTIRSRCQILPFRPLEISVVEAILHKIAASEEEPSAKNRKRKSVLIPDPGLIPKIAPYSEGSISRALDLADPEIWIFRRDFLQQLANGLRERLELGDKIAALIKASGDAGAVKRKRFRVLLELAADFYARLAAFLSGVTPDDENWRALLELAAAKWKLDAEGAAFAATRTLDRVELLERNVNMSLLLDAWLDELMLFAQGDTRRMTPSEWTLKSLL